MSPLTALFRLYFLLYVSSFLWLSAPEGQIHRGDNLYVYGTLIYCFVDDLLLVCVDMTPHPTPPFQYNAD